MCHAVCVELELGQSGLSYTPGDAVGIWPSNSRAAVDELLSVMESWGEGDLEVPTPGWYYADPDLPPASSGPLGTLLTYCYDLRFPEHIAGRRLTTYLFRRHK